MLESSVQLSTLKKSIIRFSVAQPGHLFFPHKLENASVGPTRYLTLNLNLTGAMISHKKSYMQCRALYMVPYFNF